MSCQRPDTQRPDTQRPDTHRPDTQRPDIPVCCIGDPAIGNARGNARGALPVRAGFASAAG